MRSYSSRLPAAFLTLGLWCGLASMAAAQGVIGAAVEGTVTQPGGSPAEGAQVELLSTSTGQSYRTNAGARGRYYLDNLQPGSGYTITVRAIGFSPVTRQGVSLAL
jgi:hypothetical protein